MPGGWTMSMAWMRMPGQSWPAAAAMFVDMWVAMMVPMMLPSLVPMLRHYRQAVGTIAGPRKSALTTLVALGYYVLWTLVGIVIYPLGVALTTMEMREPALSRAVPVAVGVVVIVCGAFQFSAWKLRHLSCCREAPGPGHTLPARAATAWQYGMRLGVQCAQCCAGLIAILLAVGVMDLRAMVAVTVLITLERLAPKGENVARTLGAVLVLAGLLLIVRAANGI
jgi:predicted metal-binding membrane protein